MNHFDEKNAKMANVVLFQLKFCSPYCYSLITLQGVSWKVITDTKEKPSTTIFFFSAKLVRRWKSEEEAKFELVCLLLISIFSNSKCKSLVKMRTSMLVHQDIRNRLKYLILHSPFCLFIGKKILKQNCDPVYFGTYSSWWNHQMRFKIVHFYFKNAKYRLG